MLAIVVVNGDTLETEAEVTARVPGLQALPSSSDYAEIGGTANHHGPPGYADDDNHWAHPSVVTNLQDIAREWREIARASGTQDSLQAPLKINDLSLPWGGRFDIAGQWNGSHETHRVGRDADIRTTRNLSTRHGILLTYDEELGRIGNIDFEELCLDTGASGIEIHGTGTNEHYHVYFYKSNTP